MLTTRGQGPLEQTRSHRKAKLETKIDGDLIRWRHLFIIDCQIEYEAFKKPAPVLPPVYRSLAPIRIARQRENAPPVENKIKMPSISDSLMSVMKSTCSPRLVARPVFDPTSHRSIDCWPAISHQLDRCIDALLSCRPERNYSTHQPSSLIESVVPLTIFWPAGGRPNFWFSFNSFGEYKKDLRPVKELVPNKISKRFRWWLPMEIVSPGSFVSRCHSNDKIKKESPALK